MAFDLSLRGSAGCRSLNRSIGTLAQEFLVAIDGGLFLLYISRSIAQSVVLMPRTSSSTQ
jgi:hypothetical protein